MPETSRTVLRALLLEGYQDLVRSLTRRLGSADLAEEAVQETYLRLERTAEIGPLRNPKAYLYKIALNIAADRRRAESRRLTRSEVGLLLTLPDDAPQPDREVEARRDVELLSAALMDLPERRRNIFLAAWVEELPRADIARRFGVSVRTVKAELKAAREFCALRLRKGTKKDFTIRPRRTSEE
ncbi:RNA polymerase sigma factor [Tepidicaulis sp. LMO-SS28]|uniref:RNA polymerase sigma factor n=1 Tax=Tepidicaulis sp. LMO-SS28 TaxID=3447455 RepID=UPI003EE38D9C